MCKGNLLERQGNGGLVRTDGLARQGFPLSGLGISDCGGCDGLAMACFCVVVQMVLKSTVAYVFLHFAGVEEGLNGLATHVLSF